MAAPTLYCLDSFEHGLTTATSGTGPYDVNAGTPSIVTTNPRTGLRCLEISASAAAERVGYNIPASTRIVTQAFAIYFPSAIPTADCVLAYFANANGNGQIRFDNASDRFQTSINATNNQSFGPNPIVADTWYLIVTEFDTSTGTASLRATCYSTTGSIIGSGVTSSRAQTAADNTVLNLGTASAETYTARYDDWFISITDGDYEIWLAPWEVQRLKPTSDGTHNIGAANEFEVSASGTDITNSTTDAYTLLDDDTIDTTPTDYVNHVGTSATNYVEVVLENGSYTNGEPLDVRGYVAYRDSVSTGTTTEGCELYDTDTTYATLHSDVKTKVDTGNTTIKTYAHGSTANVHTATRPSGGWNRTKVDALRARFGGGDGAPDGHFSTFMVDVALMAQNATPTPSAAAAVADVPAPSLAATAVATPSVVAAVASVPAPTLASDNTATPATVAAIASVPDPTIDVGTSPDATATPATVAAVGAVPAPTILAAAVSSPSTVAAVASVPAPTVLAAAIATPSTVSGVASVPAPTTIPETRPTPAAVAAIAAVPAPAVLATAVATPTTVAAIAAVPAPTAQGAARPTPSTVVGVAAVPAPAVSGGAVASPSTAAAVASVPAPTVRGAAVTQPSTVAAVATVPTPTIDVAGNAVATPATVAAVASVPAPSVTGTSSVSPSTVTAVASVPPPSTQATAIASGATVAAVAVISAPSVGANATPTPPTVVAIVTIPAPTVQGTAVVAPATVGAIVLVAPPHIVAGGAPETPVALPGSGDQEAVLAGSLDSPVGLIGSGDSEVTL